MFLLFLVACTLAFGLHARLSQYLPEAAFHPTPLALYDQDAQSSKLLCSSLGSIFRHASVPLLPSLPETAGGTHRPLVARRGRQVSKAVPQALPAYYVPLFFRPPPALS